MKTRKSAEQKSKTSQSLTPKILVSSDYELDREKTKAAWKERMQAQYASYKYKALRGLVSLYYEYQENRLATENRYRIIKELAGLSEELKAEIDTRVEPIKKLEDYFAKQIENEVEKIPIYNEWLTKQKGVGAVYSGCLIAWIQDIGKFDTISKLHRYCGLSAINGKAQRRSLGSHIDYNPKLKTLMFKIGSSFMMSKNPIYRKAYDEAHKMYEDRGEYSEENPGGYKNKKHLQFRAMKKMERIFVANLWIEWRKLENLPTSEPYIFAIGGHDKGHLVTS